MKIRNLLLKNMSIQMLSQALSIVLGLIGTALLSRYLGVEAFGQFNYLFAFYYFFMTLNDLGVDVVAIREMSKHPNQADKILGSLRTFKLLLATTLLMTAWGCVAFFKFKEPLSSSLKIFGFILPIIALQIPSLILQVKLKLEYGALIGLINRIVNFTCIVLVVTRGLKIRALSASVVLGELVSLLLIILFTRPYVRPRWEFDLDIYKKVFRSSIPIALTGIFVAILNRVDFLMLERMTDIHQVGLYAASYKVTNLMETLPSMMMATLFPLMSRYANEDFGALKNVYRKSNLILTTMAVPLGVLITFFAPMFARYFFGTAFIQACHGLRILVWASVSLYMALPAGHLLISMGHEKISLVANFFAAAANIGLNVILIPRWSLWVQPLRRAFAIFA